MKTLILITTLIPMLCLGQAHYPKGKVIVERIAAQALKNNSGGENSIRRVTIYLPPDYEKTTNRYSTIYYLHGFTNSDSLAIAEDHFDQVLDKAIATGKIKPVIVVIPNEYTLFRGSFYTNSSLTGNWADFTAKDLVDYIDQHYRTVASRESRGLTGHSMGGHGALKVGMLFPDVFSCVYALSPAALGLSNEFGPNGDSFRKVQKIKTREELITGYNYFLENALVAIGRAYSPNLNNPPFYTDLPFTYIGDSMIVNSKVLDLWNKNSPLGMLDKYSDNLRKLKALKLDWGRNDWAQHIPVTCLQFSQKLENMGIEHYAEEFIGNHENKLWTDDGRVLNDMLPFFNSYLTFEETKYKTTDTKKRNK